MTMSERMTIGRTDGVCTAACRYDIDGVCGRCGALDPYEYVAYRLPTEETAKRERALATFTQVAEELGIDPSILQVWREKRGG